MRWKCFSSQQPAVSSQSERSWRVLVRKFALRGLTIDRARPSFRRRHRAYAPMVLPWMRAVAVLMLLPIIKRSSRDSDRSPSTASQGNSRDANSSLPASLRSEVSQQPTASVQRPVGSGRGVSLHWLLAAGCWLLQHFGRRPPKADVPPRRSSRQRLAELHRREAEVNRALA